jgi:PAS domain S-box-containing protein
MNRSGSDRHVQLGRAMVNLAGHRPHATARATLKTPQPTDHACDALQQIRRQLTQLSSLGGGAVTPGLLQAAIDDCVDAVVVTNPRAQIVMVNGAAATLVGISTRELQKLTVWDITETSFQADFDVLWREFLRAGKQRGQYALRHADGSIVDVAYCSEVNVIAERHISIYRRLR